MLEPLETWTSVEPFEPGSIMVVSGHESRRWWQFWRPKSTLVTRRYICGAVITATDPPRTGENT